MNACSRKPAIAFQRRSPPSGRRWQFTAGMASRAPYADHPCSESCTRRTKQTTAQPVRRVASCSRTARCRACCGRTGRERSTSSSDESECRAVPFGAASVGSESGFPSRGASPLRIAARPRGKTSLQGLRPACSGWVPVTHPSVSPLRDVFRAFLLAGLAGAAHAAMLHERGTVRGCP